MVLIFRPHITFYPPDMTSTASVATTRRLARNNSAVVRSTAPQQHGVQLLGRAVCCHCCCYGCCCCCGNKPRRWTLDSFGDPGVVISFGPCQGACAGAT